MENEDCAPRIAKPGGLVTCDHLEMKFYSMLLENQARSSWDNVNAKTFLRSEVARKHIPAFSGLGFAILSRDMLNAGVWDGIVLKNQIYGFKQDDFFATVRPMEIKDVGSFCVWELGIVQHERNAWIKYLMSKRTGEDKTNYIGSFIEGKL